MNLNELTSFYNEITPTDEQKRKMYARIKSTHVEDASL